MLHPRIYALVFAALGVLVLPPKAVAQAPDDVSVRLSSFDASAAPDRPLRVALEITNGGTSAIEDIAVSLTIRERVRSRSALHVALDREPQGAILAVTTEDLAESIAAGATAPVTIQRDLGSLANAFTAGRGGDGVYPLTIRVQVAGREVAERSTAFVFLATPPDTQLNVVWVMPLHRTTAMDSTGAYNRTTLTRELLANGTLRRAVEMLERYPAAALTLAPAGLLAHELRDLSDGFMVRGEGGAPVAVPATDQLAVAAQELLPRLRTVMASPSFEIATMPYSRADISALVAADMADDAIEQVTAGRQAVRELFARESNPAVFVNANYHADAGSAGTIAELGAKVLVLDQDDLRERPEGRFGNPDRPEEVRASGESFDALIVDEKARDRMQPPSSTPDLDPVLQAMGALAEAAVTFFEVPGLAPARTFVFATNGMPSPAIAGPLLDALAASPWSRIRTVSDVIADPELRPAAEPLRLASRPLTTPTRLSFAKSARRQVSIFERVVQAPDIVGDLERRILIAESADYAGQRSGAVGSAIARSARDRAQSALARITVPPRRVTLTSRTGRAPVTVVNETGFEIKVMVRLDSAKVAFPDGSTRLVTVQPEPGRQTVEFDVDPIAAGSFPVSVVLTTPDGRDEIGSGRLLVRSTAVSAVAFAATAGGALFLLGAWARRAFVRRPKTKANG